MFAYGVCVEALGYANSQLVSDYPDQYEPGLLKALSRAKLRAELSHLSPQPLFGWDCWHAFDLSWLNASGVPNVAVLRVRLAADSESLPESKSFKLYLNSLFQTRMSNLAGLQQCIADDLSSLLKGKVDVMLFSLSDWAKVAGKPAALPGSSLDEQNLVINSYDYEPALLGLHPDSRYANEQVHSHLLRTLCPLTNQPDWASLLVSYQGTAICHQGLLRYIVGYRNFAGFHEQVIEQIYQDIMQCCQPETLEVYGCFQRRGGLDINPYRATQALPFEPLRTARQ